MRYRVVLTALLAFHALRGTANAQGDKWFQLSSEHFTLFTDTSEAKGRRLLTDFEARVATFSQTFGEVPARQFPIQIFVFKLEEDFVQVAPRPPAPATAPTPSNVPFMGSRSAPRPDKAAYLLRGPDRVFIVSRDKSPDDIADAVGHALGHVLFERYVIWRPFWLAEGAAEYIRRVGRDIDKKVFSDEEGYTASEIVTIAPSATYNDDDKPGAFRALSFRLLQMLLKDQPDVIRNYLKELRTEHERLPGITLETEPLEQKLKTWVEIPLKLPPVVPAVKGGEVPPASAAIPRGDLLVAADRASDAAKFYGGDTKEARAARGIATGHSRSPLEAIRVLDRASREVPDHGLLQYHFGAMEAGNSKDIELQVPALERAVQLLPLMGRAHAELARVYALTGQAQKGLALVERAIELEPEYADRFYEIRADVHVASGQFDEALHDVQIFDQLPHRDKSETERFMLKVAAVRKKVESIRREADDRRLQEMRRQVAAEVALREPPPKPAPPAPRVPEGAISYQIEARAMVEVVDAVYPEYPEALRKAGNAGTITLQVSVGPDGKVKTATVANSQVQALNAATLDAVKKWTFKPGNRSLRLIITYSLQ